MNTINLRKKKKKSKIKPVKKLKWAAPEFTKHPKDKLWFLGLWGIAILLMGVALLSKSFTMVIVVILAFFVIYVYALKEPRKVKFAIDGKGITVDNHFYDFDDLRSFWIFYDPPEIKELSIQSKKTLVSFIKIPLGDQNPVKIRRALLKYIPEKKQEETPVDVLARRVGF